MKLITLNCHSLVETDYEAKLHLFCEAVCKEKPQVIALQEVNQTADAAPATMAALSESGYIPCTGDAVSESAFIPVKADNHAWRAAKLLAHLGYPCTWTWVPAKLGYDRYDEGLALFSRFPVLDACQFHITGTKDYHNWKTRKVLGIRALTPAGPQNFFSLHMGWWNDDEDPFALQWERLTSRLKELPSGPIWLMGDFNSPAHLPGEGYSLVCSQGWIDTHEAAAVSDSGITVAQKIDGWRDGSDITGMRIDYIFTDSPVGIRASRVIFNGISHPIVSDHFGIMTETGGDAG